MGAEPTFQPPTTLKGWLVQLEQCRLYVDWMVLVYDVNEQMNVFSIPSKPPSQRKLRTLSIQSPVSSIQPCCFTQLLKAWLLTARGSNMVPPFSRDWSIVSWDSISDVATDVRPGNAVIGSIQHPTPLHCQNHHWVSLFAKLSQVLSRLNARAHRILIFRILGITYLWWFDVMRGAIKMCVCICIYIYICICICFLWECDILSGRGGGLTGQASI